ncbi:MAG: helix-turn-helix domain-containing protein, partial [Pseudomonadota bacterium]
GRFAAHLEETICLDLLRAWADGAGVSLETGARTAAPHYVRAAEEMMEAKARIAPTIGAVAADLGVSVRTLSEGFRRFRGITPRAFLRDRRLDGVRADLAAAPQGATVASVAADWGYVNFGALAAAYRRRFGEPPSWTLKRARRR